MHASDLGQGVMDSTLSRPFEWGDARMPPGSRPLIGVTTSEVRPAWLTHPRAMSDPERPEMALGMTYVRALERSGAIPLVIPPLELDAIDPLLEQVGAVCLSGGPDIDPSHYREKAHPALGPTWADLDRVELELARRASERTIPLLGICRGAQTLNVARGGDLHQHLPDVDSSDRGARRAKRSPAAVEAADFGVNHRSEHPGETLCHEVIVEPGTKLGEIIGPEPISVNSFHHQAVNRLGDGLRASARAPDGVIEAIEDPDHPFLIGVQWHAEFLVGREPEQALFRAFVDAASDHAELSAAGLR